MKVIIVGCSEAQNKCLGLALSDMGYNVCGFMDHYWKHRRYWNKILTVGGCSDDFIEMYNDVDVVMEIPALFFWKEILDAFPDAKIITTPSNAEDMFDSWYRLIKTAKRGPFYHFMHLISPTGWRFFNFRKNVFRFFNLDLSFVKPSLPLPTNKLLFTRLLRQHHADINQNAPKDQVFTYDSSDGWGPLCEILGVDVPDKKFPHEPSDGEIVRKTLRHPVLVRIQNEAIFSANLCGLLALVGVRSLQKIWYRVEWAVIKHVVKVWYLNR